MLVFAFVVALALATAVLRVAADDPLAPFPPPDAYIQTTSILDHSSYIAGFDEPQYYLDTIPFIDLPDQAIQDVYYYRMSVIKRHIKYTHEGQGYIFTEFIHLEPWTSKLGTCATSNAHEIMDGRWLRNPRYAKDTVEIFTRGGAEVAGGVTYTHYFTRAILETAQATGDVDWLKSQLEGMIFSYDLWNSTVDPTTDLYHRTTVLDGQEYSLTGYVVGGPNSGMVTDWLSWDNNYSIIHRGPETYRPNVNAYMVAGARAIAEVATLAGNPALAQQWTSRADTVEAAMNKLLYNAELNYWIDVVKGSNVPAVGRQLIGYFPYRFDVGTSDVNIRGLEAGLTNQAFLTEFGPTTLEQTNPYYTAGKNLTYCCLWQGQSWPYSTCLYLGTLARVARENRSDIITPELFQNAMSTYARTNYKDGVPFTAEAHFPTVDGWSGLSVNHSEHYFHSTYVDNVFSNLIGIIPTLDDRLEVRPLVPSNWTYFAVENLPYHGTLISILWDQQGNRYPGFKHDAGLSVYVNGQLMYSATTLAPFNMTLPGGQANATALASQQRYENIAANAIAPWGFPNVSADYSYDVQLDYKMHDGVLYYDTVPDNRWSNNQSGIPWVGIDITFARPRTVNSISFAIIDDTKEIGGAMACPQQIRISNGEGTVYAVRNPWTSCLGNAINTVLFDAISDGDPTNATTPAAGTNITTAKLVVEMVSQISRSIAITELQVWVPANPGPIYEFEDAMHGTWIGQNPIGTNVTVVPNGVELGENGFAEIRGVTASAPGNTTLTIIGGGGGTAILSMNYIYNQTVSFGNAPSSNITVIAPFLDGLNCLTIVQQTGTPFLDAVVVESSS